MGLAPKQRDQLSTREHVVRCFGACPTFTTGQPSWDGPQETLEFTL